MIRRPPRSALCPSAALFRSLEDVHAGGRAGPGAVLGGVVVAGPALRGAGAVRCQGLEGIGRAGARAAGAAFGHVALAGGAAADGAAGLEGVRAADAAPSAVVGGVVAAAPARPGA